MENLTSLQPVHFTVDVSLAIQDVMTPQPITIGRGETLETAHILMRQHGCRHLPVLEHNDLVGIVTQRDLYLLESITGADTKGDKIEDAMTSDAYVVPPDAPLHKVTAEMAANKYGCAVVIERGRVIGIFTTTDALRVLAGVLG